MWADCEYGKWNTTLKEALGKQRWVSGHAAPQSRIHGEEEPSVAEDDQVMKLWRNLNPYKPEDPERANQCHCNVFIIPVIFERLWRMKEVPYNWRKVNVVHVFKKGSNKPSIYRLASLTRLPGKTMERILSATASEYMKVKKWLEPVSMDLPKVNHVQQNWLP